MVLFGHSPDDEYIFQVDFTSTNESQEIWDKISNPWTNTFMD